VDLRRLPKGSSGIVGMAYSSPEYEEGERFKFPRFNLKEGEK